MAMTRRTVLLSGVSSIIGGTALLRSGRAAAQTAAPGADDTAPVPSVPIAAGYLPVITPNGTTLPWRVVNGVKVFHLIAEPVHHVVAPGLEIEA